MDKTVIAQAPASVANVIVGFDILGVAIPTLYDRVILRKIPNGVRIKSISGVVTNLPMDASKNTAGYSLVKMIEMEKLDFGFEIEIEKGIPLGSGLGGSAASAVAAVVAANEFLEQKLPKSKLFEYAILGESVASGSLHGDNVGASLYGGLIACIGTAEVNDFDNMRILPLPFPDSIYMVIAHPDIIIKTKQARELIASSVSLSEYVKQTMYLTSFIIGCYENNIEIFNSTLKDIIIERQRKSLIPEFDELKEIALDHEAIGFSISGAGPSMVGFCMNKLNADQIVKAYNEISATLPYKLNTWTTQIDKIGAHIVKGD